MTAPLNPRVSPGEHRIELRNGGLIEAWSLDNDGSDNKNGKVKYKAGRSRKYKRVGIDEAGLVNNLEGIFNYAIGPTLIDYKGDAWFTGTPNGKNGFYRFWLKGQDSSSTDWKSWKIPTSANPYISHEEIERARIEYPETVFRQEYEAEFIDDGGLVFRNITECTLPMQMIWREQAEAYHVYVISCDWAKKADFSAFTVIDCTEKKVVNIDRFNRVEYMLQIPRLVALCEAFQPVEVISEINGNEALAEILKQTPYRKYTDPMAHDMLAIGFGKQFVTKPSPLPITDFTVSNASKEEAIQALVLSFERKEIRIPNYPALIQELEVFGMERLPSGKFRYAAPGDDHDDTVMSLSEGWFHARRYMSEELLPLRIKAFRSLDDELKPENIGSNTSVMALTSQNYHIQSFEKKEKKAASHFMKKSGFGTFGRSS